MPVSVFVDQFVECAYTYSDCVFKRFIIKICIIGIWVYYEFRKVDRCKATGPVLDQRLLLAVIIRAFYL